MVNFLATDFLRRVGLKDLAALPHSCPLAPSRSIYGDHEQHKAQQRPQDWKVWLTTVVTVAVVL